jgi:alpha-D-xyloside xylohydrolase
MPYIYAQAKDSSAKGFPMLRTLFFEFPKDPTSWLIEDEYMFGSDLLVAPLFEDVSHRRVYLPPGTWIDYQTGKTFEGERWHDITAGEIPIVLLVKNNSVLPMVKLAQSTADIDWKNIELRILDTGGSRVTGLFALPGGDLQKIELQRTNNSYTLTRDFSDGKIKWSITRAGLSSR